MNTRLNKDKIARGLGAVRRGRVSATGGWFGAMGLLAEIEARFRVPDGGGRPTDPNWTERRLIALAPQTLHRLEAITTRVRKKRGVNLGPMQLAALLLENAAAQISDDETETLVTTRHRSCR